MTNARDERANKLENARQSIFYARIALAPMIDEFQSVKECDTGLKIVYEHLGRQIEKLTEHPPITRY